MEHFGAISDEHKEEKTQSYVNVRPIASGLLPVKKNVSPGEKKQRHASPHSTPIGPEIWNQMT